MNYLVDTNILLRLVDTGHAMHQEAVDAIKILALQAQKLHIVPQNFYEIWVVCTRPKDVNGLGKTADEAVSELAYLRVLFHWLDDIPPVYGVWEHLVSSIPIIGKNGHDARFVAAMTVHGLTHLLTFNIQDFRQYSGITAVSPADILTSGPPMSGAVSL
jgi:predicted nucleic acid-binding protein